MKTLMGVDFLTLDYDQLESLLLRFGGIRFSLEWVPHSLFWLAKVELQGECGMAYGKNKTEALQKALVYLSSQMDFNYG